MTRNRPLLSKKLKGLYAITDESLIAKQDFKDTVEQALRGGARIIQYRDKSHDEAKRTQQALVVRELCTRYQATCIINDDIELARLIQADGVHLGRDDVAIAVAREQLGEQAVIGISCYDDIDLALSAQASGADYVAFGAIFPSPTKPHAASAGVELLAEAKQRLATPICAIGGINSQNIAQVITQGADMAAVISDLFTHEDTQLVATRLSSQFIDK